MHTLLHTVVQKRSQLLVDPLLTKQSNVDCLLIPLLCRELALAIALLDEILHDIDLHRLNACIGAELIVQLTSTAIVMR